MEVITVDQANDKLLAKRKELGISPSTPSTSKPSDIIKASFREYNVAAERSIDEYERGRQEWRARQLQENIDHPERILKQAGVGKRHLGCTLDGYEGKETLVDVCYGFLSEPFDLVLSGGPGCGKTHLAVAILRELIVAGILWSGNGGRFVPVPELLAEIRASYQGKGPDEKELVKEYSTIPYLVLDDLGAEKTTDWSIATLYLIIDRRHREMLPTIVTTNLTLDQIDKHLSPRIASRLASGKVTTIKGPDYRTKRSA